MGGGRWSSGDFETFARMRTLGRSAEQVFTSKATPRDLDPARFAVRESRDSASNPNSTAIGVFADVTGSMGVTAETLVRRGLDTVMREIHARRPVTDPHLLVGAVGDAFCDRSPLQMTQFEATVVLADQLSRIHVEHGGGGNGGESYLAAHYGMGMKTSIDCFEKRGRKGFLFTVGDEPNHGILTRGQVKAVFGLASERDLTARECLEIAQRQYEVFHVMLVNEGYCSAARGAVEASWKPLLGERLLPLDDVTRLGELIVSTLQVVGGARVGDVASSWSGTTAMTIADALGGLTRTVDPAAGRSRRF